MLPGDLEISGSEKDHGFWSSSEDEDSSSEVESADTSGEPKLEINGEFGQDTSALESLVSRYKLIVSERHRLETSLAEFDKMYTEARSFLRQLHLDLKELRDVLADLREAHSILQRRIKTVQSERANLAKKIREGR